jgi:hypothetical protein
MPPSLRVAEAVRELRDLAAQLPSNASPAAIEQWARDHGPAWDDAAKRLEAAGIKLSSVITPARANVLAAARRMPVGRTLVSFFNWLVWGSLLGLLISIVYPQLLPHSVWRYVAILLGAAAVGTLMLPLRRWLWRFPLHGRYPVLSLGFLQGVAALLPFFYQKTGNPNVCWAVGLLATVLTLISPLAHRRGTRFKDNSAPSED